ncbi:MAG: sugar MFS transporter [Planctomycetota bacterium]
MSASSQTSGSLSPAALLVAPLAASYASLFALGMTDNARGPLLGDLQRGLELGDGGGSLLFATTSVGVIAGSLAARRLLRRWPARRVLQVALLVLAAGLAGTAGATGLASLLPASLCFGLGGGVLSLAQNLMVEQSAPAWLRRRAFAGLHAMYGVASLLAPLVAAAGLHLGSSWRGCLLGLAVVPLVIAALSGLAPAAPPPRRAQAHPDGAPLGLGPWLVALATGCCVVAELLLSTRLPLLLEREGLSPDAAKQHLSGFFACLLAARLFVTFVPVPLSNRRFLLLCAGAALGLFAFGLSAAPRLLPLTALAIGPMFPVAAELLAEEYSDRLEAALSALVATCSVLLVAANLAVGWLCEEVSLRGALVLGPAALGLTLALLLGGGVWERRRSDPRDR